MSYYTRTQRKYILLGFIALLFIIIFIGYLPFMNALLGTLILYGIFRPLFRYLADRRGWNRSLAAVLVLVLSFLVIILPFAFLTLLLANKVVYYSQNYHELLAIVEQAQNYFGIDIKFEDILARILEELASTASQIISVVVGQAVNFIISIGLIYLLLFFMYKDEAVFLKTLRRYSPFSPRTNRLIDMELQRTIQANVVGQGVISLVQSGVMGLGFVIFGHQDAFFWSVVAFFLAFVPILGTPLVWVPAAALAIAQGEMYQGVGLLIYGSVLVVNVDNLLRMWVSKLLGDIHPVVTIMGIVFGVPMFGVLGLVVGPLLILWLLLLIKAFDREYETDFHHASFSIIRRRKHPKKE